jgi:hypothetical protein
MEIIQLKEELDNAKKEIHRLHDELEEVKNRLKKYTYPESSKKYYEKHKDELRIYKQEYYKVHKIDPEKKAEYNKAYYQRKKEEKLKNNLNI